MSLRILAVAANPAGGVTTLQVAGNGIPNAGPTLAAATADRLGTGTALV
jgi:hypothetical protein